MLEKGSNGGCDSFPTTKRLGLAIEHVGGRKKKKKEECEDDQEAVWGKQRDEQKEENSNILIGQRRNDVGVSATVETTQQPARL